MKTTARFFSCFSLLCVLLLFFLWSVDVSNGIGNGFVGITTEPDTAVKVTAKTAATTSSLSSSSPSLKETKVKASDFFRVQMSESPKQPLTLDTAVVTFTSVPSATKPQVTVDLIAAIHIGDKAYYEELNRRFRDYDVVLYELVAPEGTRPDPKDVRERDTKSDGVIGGLQFGLSNMLGLVHQLEYIDYTAKNLRHADMDGTEFMAKVVERGDIPKTLMRVYVSALAKSNSNQGSEFKLFSAFFSKNRPLALKRFFAEEMVQNMDEAWILGGDEGSAIITDRNAIALVKLREQIAAGNRKIAIFYGGAHLPEFVTSLTADFNFVEQPEKKWIVAWDMTKN